MLLFSKLMKNKKKSPTADPTPLLLLPTAELTAPEVIRVETALTRYPIHQLAKRGGGRIVIREPATETTRGLVWEVEPHPAYGPPGPLAYKIDTLIVNRRVERLGRPLPRYVRLGFLSEICRELELADSGANRAHIRRAIHQNATALIRAELSYVAADGNRRLVAVGNRYTVWSDVREGEGGAPRDDAIVVELNDFYRKVLDLALRRPLDYTYLRDLTPIAQRWYELVSFRVYGALKNGLTQARLDYDEFCTFAPQARYVSFGAVRKQMAKVHQPHLDSGYITAAEVETTTDPAARPSWTMVYTLGPKARAEYELFRRGAAELLDVELPGSVVEPGALLALADPGTSVLEQELVRRGVAESVARELIRDHPERVLPQIAAFDRLMGRRGARKGHDNPPGYLVAAIRGNYPVVTAPSARDAAPPARDAAGATPPGPASPAAGRAVEARVREYLAALAPGERERLEADALTAATPEDRTACERATPPSLRRAMLRSLCDAHVRRLLGLAPTE